MTLLQILEAEAKNLTRDLNDDDLIMESDWREFLETRREDVWKKIEELKS